ncbi:DUF3060 domain-containing protein [Mycobacterium sp.]|uniref:DUF3060 domain-containing protein n=1 Tax=Mycobacterium sp. TaxID=1785 RepID=UPI002DB4D8ED|nr:DUF3060 domain-containing protein [Mycobacterium sp.]
MQPQDDPEARIRDLERPLADVARTSELGTTEYPSGADYNTGAYMPPPVQTYGAPPYMGMPQKPKSGFSAWWLFAGIAVVLLFIAGGVVIFSATMFNLDSDTRPPIEIPEVYGGGGQVDKAPTGQPGTPGTPGREVIVETPSAAPVVPPGAPLVVSGIRKNETIACNDNDDAIVINGIENTITITGHCASLTVSGVQNVVTVDSTDAIDASGIENRVIYHSGEPAIDTAGSDNLVEQG